MGVTDGLQPLTTGGATGLQLRPRNQIAFWLQITDSMQVDSHPCLLQRPRHCPLLTTQPPSIAHYWTQPPSIAHYWPRSHPASHTTDHTTTQHCLQWLTTQPPSIPYNDWPHSHPAFATMTDHTTTQHSTQVTTATQYCPQLTARQRRN